MQKVELLYMNGYCLLIPKDNNASMLFLEWLATFSAGQSPLFKVIDEDGNLYARLAPANQQLKKYNGNVKKTYLEAMEYINNNL